MSVTFSAEGCAIELCVANANFAQIREVLGIDPGAWEADPCRVLRGIAAMQRVGIEEWGRAYREESNVIECGLSRDQIARYCQALTGLAKFCIRADVALMLS